MPRPKITDDEAIVLDAAPTVESTADPKCAACKTAQSDLHNGSAACEKHAQFVRCFVREPAAGIMLVFGDALPGDEVKVASWEFALPSIRRVLETAEERDERIATARRSVNDERRAKLAAIHGSQVQQARAREESVKLDAARAKADR